MTRRTRSWSSAITCRNMLHNSNIELCTGNKIIPHIIMKINICWQDTQIRCTVYGAQSATPMLLGTVLTKFQAPHQKQTLHDTPIYIFFILIHVPCSFIILYCDQQNKFKLYYQQLHLKYLCNLAKYWLWAPWGWYGSVETCRSVIICKLIVHLLVIIQNKKTRIYTLV